MKPIHATRAAAPILAVLLAACGSGSDGDDAPNVEVTDLAAGTYAVASGDAANPTAGKYYAGADGSRLLVLNDAAQLATAMYRRDGNGRWEALPAAGAAKVALLTNSRAPSATVDPGKLARGYSVRLASGAVAAFTLNAAGELVAGASTCKLSGKATASPLPNALKLTLAASGCGDLPAQSDGYLIVDEDYAPAAFRLVTAGTRAPVDLWVYAE